MKSAPLLLIIIVAAIAALASTSATAADSNRDNAAYVSSSICGACHMDIFDTWKKSMHALSTKNYVFDQAYSEAYRKSGGEAKYLCLKCHAPTTYLNKDYDMKLDITKEGVTCDFCHTVKEVNLKNPDNPFVIETGPVKRGTMKEASSPAHRTEFSELHKSSLLCAGCHEFVNSKGMHVRSTYSDWHNGPYRAEGKQCQGCHMPEKDGNVVAPQVKSSKPSIKGHNISLSVPLLKNAVDVRILEAKRKDGRLFVTVEVTNKGAGHTVPTGSPGKKLQLKVEVKPSQGMSLAENIIYQKVAAGGDSSDGFKEGDVTIGGEKIVLNSLIGPKEKRVEHFVFKVPRIGGIKLGAYLSYQYNPLLRDDTKMNIEIAKDERYFDRSN